MDNDLAIYTEKLCKVYGDKVAVNHVHLSVRRGEIFGFLGPNGAGKTTAIKMMLGLTSPTSGECRIFGQSIGNPAIRAKIGFLPENFRFHQWLTAREFLTLHAKLYGMDEPARRRSIPQMLERVNLIPYQDKQLKTFSKGMLQRIGLAQALLNEPELVFLDEPTSGLDPIGRRMVRDIISDLRKNGTCVFLNSHFLSEVEITCDRVAFIKEGKIITSVNLQTLTEGQCQVLIRADGWNKAILEELHSYGKEIRLDGQHLSMVIENENILPRITRYLVERGVDLYAITPQRTSLEEIFIQMIGTEGVL